MILNTPPQVEEYRSYAPILLHMYLTREGLSEKDRQRGSVGEALSENVQRKRSNGEGPTKKIRRRRPNEEGPMEKI